MVLKATPWWVYGFTFTAAILLGLFTVAGAVVKSSSGTEPAGGSSTTQTAGDQSTLTRDTAVGSVRSGNAAVAQGNSRVNQTRLQAEAIGHGATIALGDVNQQTTNITFVVRPSINEPNFRSTVYSGSLETTRGLAANVEVMILWMDASWQFGTLAYNDRALTRFLESPDYVKALSDSDAIVCIGLSSHFADRQRTITIPSLPQSAVTENEEKTDQRALKLCQRLASHAEARDISPTFFGVGLGYHLTPDDTDAGEKQQRAIVIIRVNTGTGVSPAAAEVKSLFRQILQHPEIKEFEGWKYSRVSKNSPICWFQVAVGSFQADLKDCK